MNKKINTFTDDNPEAVMLIEKTSPCVPAGLLTGALTTADDDKQKYAWPDDIIELCENLIDTATSLKDDKGNINAIGLAAPQIWDKPEESCPSIFLMRWPTFSDKQIHWDWKIIINATIILSGKKVKRMEGCLSLPGQTYKVIRRSNVVLTYYELDSKEPKTIKFYAAASIAPFIVQHEMDHLNGILICKNKLK